MIGMKIEIHRSEDGHLLRCLAASIEAGMGLGPTDPCESTIPYANIAYKAIEPEVRNGKLFATIIPYGPRHQWTLSMIAELGDSGLLRARPRIGKVCGRDSLFGIDLVSGA